MIDLFGYTIERDPRYGWFVYPDLTDGCDEVRGVCAAGILDGSFWIDELITALKECMEDYILNIEVSHGIV